MEKTKIASLQIWNEEFYILPVLSFMDSLAARHKSMEISRYQQLRLVVGEMLKRRIANSYPGGRGELYVEFYLAKAFFEVSIRDKGVPGWVDFSYDKSTIAEDRENLNKYILNMYADESGMEKLGSEGQRIFVRKNILNPVEFKKPKPYSETEALDNNITIRPVVTEEDVIEAIRCIYSEYGYSYSYERLYYVDSFMNLLKTKELMSFLAVNDHGQTAGHFALAFSELYKNMPEISTVVIRKEFRGLGLFSRFMEYSEELGKKEGFRALMGQPVTFHPMSQKAFLRAGYTATSLLMSYLGTDIESEYNQNSERLGLCVGVKMLNEKAYTQIYPPKEIAEFVKKVYDRLGLKADMCRGGGKADATKINVDTNKLLQMTKILLYEGGADAEETLKGAIDQAIRRKSEMIELVILLNSPSCEYSYQTAKECGFALSGIIPGGENGDYIIMQMLPGDKIDYDKLVMVGEFEEMKNDILKLL